MDSSQIETFSISEEVSHRQTMTLGKSSVITYACSGGVSAGGVSFSGGIII